MPYPFQDNKPLKFNWDKELKETPLLYKLLMPVATIVLKVPFKGGFECSGAENVPTNGPFLLACNHEKGIDPIAVVYASRGKRTMYFMAKEAFFHVFYISPFLTFFHGFPIRKDRVIDRTSIQFAERVLEEGFGLMIFPEGKRIKDHTRPKVEDGQVGFAMIVREKQVPVLPVSVHVKELANGKEKCYVRIGELIPYEDLGFTPGKKKSKELQSVTNLVMEKIIELWDRDA